MALPAAPQPPVVNTTPAITAGAAPKLQLGAPAVFDGVDEWPQIDDALRAYARELIAKKGIRNWTFAGGTEAADGQPTFGEQSNVAAELLTATINQAGRFRYIDESGIDWAVLIGNNTASYWTGLALGCTGSVAMLTRRQRGELQQQAAQSAATLSKPSGPLTSEVQRSRMRLTQMQRWLANLDAAAAFLTYMSADLICLGPQHDVAAQFAAEAAWGADQLAWPHPWRAAVFDGFAVLGSIPVQKVRFTKRGWQPEPLARQLACFGVTWRDTETLVVTFSKLFVQFVAEWLAPGKPAAVYAARHADDLRQPREGEPL